MTPQTDVGDFTAAAYRSLLDQTKERWAFEPFGTASDEPHVLWRHDIDFSLDQALAIARIEAEAGVRTTYFVMVRSDFYNALGPENLRRMNEISALGHWLGLHFDAAGVGSEELDAHAEFDREILAGACRAEITAISFHNPDAGNDAAFERDRVAGLVNTYGPDIRSRYSYVSDSNGYWRHRSLGAVIADGSERLLHVLTHPVWWPVEPLSPRDRVRRCFANESAGALAHYDAILASHGRLNLGVEQA